MTQKYSIGTYYELKTPDDETVLAAFSGSIKINGKLLKHFCYLDDNFEHVELVEYNNTLIKLPIKNMRADYSKIEKLIDDENENDEVEYFKKVDERNAADDTIKVIQ